MQSSLLSSSLIFFGLLLHPGLGEPILSTAETYQSPFSDSDRASVQHLLSSISSTPAQPLLPQNGVSCNNLMPDALEHFADIPQQPQTIIRASLALALQGAGCSWHAEFLALHLYKDLGQDDASELLSAMSQALSPVKAAKHSGSKIALDFNLNQLAHRPALRCKGMKVVNGSSLYGQVHSTHRWLGAAVASCHRLGNTCAGVSTNGTNSFQVIFQNGSYFLPHHGHQSWLHQCHRASRERRAIPEECINKSEEEVHSVVDWIPVVSTYYNFGTSLYYATRGCTELAKERALEGLVEVGYDALMAATGFSGGIIGVGITTALRPGAKIGARTLFNRILPDKTPLEIPSDYSGPVIII